jgi:hypothetical protein
MRRTHSLIVRLTMREKSRPRLGFGSVPPAERFMQEQLRHVSRQAMHFVAGLGKVAPREASCVLSTHYFARVLTNNGRAGPAIVNLLRSGELTLPSGPTRRKVEGRGREPGLPAVATRTASGA